MDRFMNRAFSKVHAVTKEKLPVPEDGDGDAEASAEASGKETDVAGNILRLIEEKEYFSCFDLPKPRFNALDKPVWDVTDSELSRAFRKKSLRIHPDKNPDPRAREAFDALNTIYQALQDPIQRGEWVRDAAERYKRMEKTSWNPSDDVTAEIEKISAHQSERRELKKEEANSFASEIAAQLKQKRVRSQYKAACVRASKYNAADSDKGDSDSDSEKKPQAKTEKDDGSDEDEAAKRSAKRGANAKRKKPKFIM